MLPQRLYWQASFICKTLSLQQKLHFSSQNYSDRYLTEWHLHKGGQRAVHSLTSPYKVHCSHLQIFQSRGSSKTLLVIVLLNSNIHEYLIRLWMRTFIALLYYAWCFKLSLWTSAYWILMKNSFTVLENAVFKSYMNPVRKVMAACSNLQ